MCLNVAPNSCISGLHYKPMMIVNDDSRVITKLETSLTDDTRVVIYDRNTFIVQVTDHRIKGINFDQRFLLSPVACTINVYDRKAL